jgi:hypothetical protein
VIAGLSADAIVLLHLAFIVFVAVGGFLALRWPRIAWIHLPAAVWGILIELNGWVCPLTPLENRLRAVAGDPAYTGGFIDRYIMPIVYPPGLSRSMQVIIGCTVIGFNLLIYGRVFARGLKKRRLDD